MAEVAAQPKSRVIEVLGKRIRVGPEFEALSDADKQKTVDEIAAQIRGTERSQTEPAQQEGGRDGKGFLEKLDAGVRGLADTLTFGFSDEISAGLGTGFGYLGDYDAEVERQRAIDDYDDENNWLPRITGQVSGALIPAMGMTKAASGALASPGLAKNLAVGAGIGAAEGAAYGFGSGDGDIVDRGMNAIGDGALGLAGGAAGAAIGRGVGSLVSRGRRKAAEAAIEEAGVDAPAANTVGRVLEDEVDAGTLDLDQLSRNPNSMLADASGGMQGVLDRNLQKGGKGAAKAARNIEDRASASSGTLRNTLDRTLGLPQGVESARRGIREGSAAARGSVYDDAYAVPIDYASTQGRLIEQIVRNRVPGSVISKANQLMRMKGLESQQILANIADDGTVTFERLPDVRQIDYISRALGDMAQSAEGKGAMGGTNTFGNTVEDLQRDLRTAARQAVPEYDTALKTSADVIQRTNGVKFGANLLSPSVELDEVFRQINMADQPVVDAMKQGLRGRIENTVSNVRRTITDPNVDARQAASLIKEFSSSANRQKIIALMGPEDAELLFAQLDEAAEALNLRAAVHRNSRTYGREAVEETMKQEAQPGFIGSFIERGESGGLQEGVKNVIRNSLGNTEDVASRLDEISGQISELLTGPRGPEATRVAQLLIEAGVNQREAIRIAQRLAYPVTGAAVGATVGGAATQTERPKPLTIDVPVPIR